MTRDTTIPTCMPLKVRCAIYTRKSTDEGLDSDFNSLDAQRESGEAFIASQRHEGWVTLPQKYDDGGFSGGSMERPALERLLEDVENHMVDCVVVYKVDRLSRSLLDFARIMEVFDNNGVSFVSVTQSFSTTSSMGRLTLNILLSFAQFEREIIGERIRDKVAAAKRKGKFTGGTPPLGYNVHPEETRLIVNPEEAKLVRHIFKRFTETGSPLTIAAELNKKGITTKAWLTKHGAFREGKAWNKVHIYRVLHNRTYLGEVKHRDKTYPGEHEPIVSKDQWLRAHAVIEENKRNHVQNARAKAPALLRGIIRCGTCDTAMSPVSAVSRGKTYRYYQCGHASKSGYSSCPVKSVPAGDIEGAVMGQLRAIFKSAEMIAQTYQATRGLEAEEIVSRRDIAQCLRRLDPIWDELFPVEQIRIVQLLVEQVTVNTDGMNIRIRGDGLKSLVSEVRETTVRQGRMVEA